MKPKTKETAKDDRNEFELMAAKKGTSPNQAKGKVLGMKIDKATIIAETNANGIFRSSNAASAEKGGRAIGLVCGSKISFRPILQILLAATLSN